MSEIIDFNQLKEEPDLGAMSAEELRAYLKAVRVQLDQLDKQEPMDINSEEYEAWGDRHEALEDLSDEILDLLDELGGAHD